MRLRYKNSLRLIWVLLLTSQLSAQNTVGLLSYDISQAYQGYTLIYPHNQASIYLINNCGEIVHSWEDESMFRPGNTAYLMDDGSLIKAKRMSSVTQDSIWAGGGGAIVEIRSWENDLIWSYELNSSQARLHHDIAPMPNGNILMLAWEKKTFEEALDAGRDPSTMAQGKLWPDYVFEINPSTNEIVWEWHVWDHLIQDFDETKANFGVVADHPELININWDSNNGSADWLHSNSLDYNADLDQIMISVPQFNEIWIIDHTTTSAQAAGHSGGFSNKGGDLMYRIGNAQVYDRGDSSDQVLFFQHDAHWANRFVSEVSPFANQILCFNNMKGLDYSAMEIIDPRWNMYLWEYEKYNGLFLPMELNNTVTHPIPTSFYSTGLSSVQLLPNGNILACSGRQGYIIELNSDNELVWEYKTPLIGGQAIDQGTELSLNNNLTFRAFKYPEDYSAFDGKDLSPKGFIELSPVLDYCDRLVATVDPEIIDLHVFPNPAKNMIHVTWNNGFLSQIQIYDLYGRMWMESKGNGGMKYLDVSSLNAGVYFVKIKTGYQEGTARLIIP